MSSGLIDYCFYYPTDFPVYLQVSDYGAGLAWLRAMIQARAFFIQ